MSFFPKIREMGSNNSDEEEETPVERSLRRKSICIWVLLAIFAAFIVFMSIPYIMYFINN